MVLGIGHWWGEDIIAMGWAVLGKEGCQKSILLWQARDRAGLALKALLIFSANSPALRLPAMGNRQEEMNVDFSVALSRSPHDQVDV